MLQQSGTSRCSNVLRSGVVAESPTNRILDILDSSGLAGHQFALTARLPDGNEVAISDVLPNGTGLGADRPTYAASLTKQLIGILVALLVVEERLDVHSSIRQALSELPAWADAIQAQ